MDVPEPAAVRFGDVATAGLDDDKEMEKVVTLAAATRRRRIETARFHDSLMMVCRFFLAERRG